MCESEPVVDGFSAKVFGTFFAVFVSYSTSSESMRDSDSSMPESSAFSFVLFCMALDLFSPCSLPLARTAKASRSSTRLSTSYSLSRRLSKVESLLLKRSSIGLIDPAVMLLISFTCSCNDASFVY